eukprot:14549-Heterococcus_DN1.PRE.2
MSSGYSPHDDAYTSHQAGVFDTSSRRSSREGSELSSMQQIEARLRREGVKIVRQRDSKKEERLLKLEEKENGLVLTVLSKLSLGSRRRKSYTADDIRALSRGSEVRGSNRRSLSSSSLLNLFEPSLSVHIEFAAEGLQALDFVALTPADTTDLYNFLRQLWPRAVRGELRPPPSDSPQQVRRRLSESAPPPATLEAILGSPSVYNSARAAFAGAPRTPSLEEVMLLPRRTSGCLRGLSNDIPELPLYNVQRDSMLQRTTAALTRDRRRLDAAGGSGSGSGHNSNSSSIAAVDISSSSSSTNTGAHLVAAAAAAAGSSHRAQMVCLLSPTAAGKSVLATAAVLDSSVRSACNDAICWVTAGRNAKAKLLVLLESAARQLVAASEELSSSPSVAASIPELCTDVGQARDVLAALAYKHGTNSAICVLDDVWDQEVLEAFEGAGLKLLVTTRDEGVAARVASSGAEVLTVGGLSGAQARELLGRAARMRNLPRAADGIIRAVGGSPLALAAVGAALQHTTQWEG